MFGNVNVDYKPCKNATQLKRSCDYILGRNYDQLKKGIIKTTPELYYAFDDNRDKFAEAVLLTRRLWGKPCSDKRSNLAYKMSISFSPEDNDRLTYKQAFEIAKEFADEHFHSKGFDVMFAVHIDTEHIHAHFIIGNCNRNTGKAFRRSERDLYDMSEYFGAQCSRYGLDHSVRDSYYSEKLDHKKEKYNEAQMRKKGKETFKQELREAIDIECRDSRNKTFDDVINAIKVHYHIESRVKGNTVSFRHPEYTDKNGGLVAVRGSKLGKAYTKGGIENVINEIRRKREQERDLDCRSERGQFRSDSNGGNFRTSERDRGGNAPNNARSTEILSEESQREVSEAEARITAERERRARQRVCRADDDFER